MHSNEQVIHQFYSAFKSKSFKAMQDCYHEQAEFHDPVFQRLSAKEVKAMWEMLLGASKDLKITYETVSADDKEGKCRWQAWYTFSTTGREVHNVINASFEFRDGKIYRHYDHFNFWRWSRMALGVTGLLLGWTPFIQNKISAKAKERLGRFMNQSGRERTVSSRG